MPDVDDNEVDQLLEDVVEPPPEQDNDAVEPEEEDEDIAGIKKFLDDGKDCSLSKEGGGLSDISMRELLGLAREKLREARMKSVDQRKRISHLERAFKRKRMVNKELRSKCENLQTFIKRNRPRLYEPPVRGYWRGRPRLNRGSQTRNVVKIRSRTSSGTCFHFHHWLIHRQKIAIYMKVGNMINSDYPI